MTLNTPLSVKFGPETRKELKRVAQLLNYSENHIVQECVKAIVLMSKQTGREELPLIISLIRTAETHFKETQKLR